VRKSVSDTTIFQKTKAVKKFCGDLYNKRMHTLMLRDAIILAVLCLIVWTQPDAAQSLLFSTVAWLMFARILFRELSKDEGMSLPPPPPPPPAPAAAAAAAEEEPSGAQTVDPRTSAASVYDFYKDCVTDGPPRGAAIRFSRGYGYL
jgi:hypothetical protein